MPRLVHALVIQFPPGAPDLPDRVSAVLADFDVTAIHELGSDDEPTWRVFIAGSSRLSDVSAALHANLGDLGCRTEVVAIEDDDWAARTQANLSRITVDRVIVAPPWDIPAEVPADVHLVVIPPSMGFGTGHHETTRLCLTLLQQLALTGKRVLDVGTGSGVLAIAAALLGAADVEGIDYDEDALASARESVATNGLHEQILLRIADLRVDRIEPADVITANLTGALLIAESARLSALVPSGGSLVLSGLQAHEHPAVVAAFAPFASVVRHVREGEWDAVLLLRTPDRR